MIATRITQARIKNQPIIHKPALKSLTEVALKTVSTNYLLYKELKGLDMKYKIKVYNLLHFICIPFCLGV